MDTAGKKAHWESVYTRLSSSEVSWYQSSPDLSLELIASAGLSSRDPIIDVGAGASLLVDQLCEAGYEDLTVLDISVTALAQSKARLEHCAATIQWIENDVTRFEPARQYRLWHDRAVFHFLTDEDDRRRYVSVLERALPVGGHVIIATFATDGPSRCSGLDVRQYDASRLDDVLGDRFELAEERKEVHVTPSGGEQRFAWFRCIKAKD